MTFELLVIAGILILQPLIGLLYAYVIFRFATAFVFNRTEKAVDGRIEKVGQQLERVVGGSE